MKIITLALGFGVRVLLASYVQITFWFYAFLFLIFITLTVLWLMRKVRIYLVCALFLVGMAFGGVRTMLVSSELPPTFASLIGTQVSFEGKVVADPDMREQTNRLIVRVEKDGVATNVLAVTPLYPTVHLYDTVRVSGTLEKPEPFDGSGGRVFRYDSFLSKDQTFSILHKASLTVVASRTGLFDTVRGWFSDIKFLGIDALALALPEPQASLAAGLILGGKQGLGNTLLQDFIRSGLVHIVVLSGYNVMIVADAVLASLGFLAKKYATAVATSCILAFVLAAGAGAASIRAGIMAGIALYARATGRTYDVVRALILAGFVMLMFTPFLLAFDPGFQLSFIATLGLIFGVPITEKWFEFVRIGFVREIIATTVAAQIAVLPILLYQNGLFSFVALPANILVLPLVPLTMFLSFLALLAGMFVPLIAPFVAFPAYVLLSFITKVVSFSSSLPFATVSFPSFSFVFVIIAYVAMITFVATRKKTPS